MDGKEDFKALAARQLPRLYSIARRLVGDDAEDAVQDCLLKAFKRFDQLHDERAAQAWLVSILVNSCRDLLRAKARQPAEVSIDDLEEFSLYRRLSDEDPFPYSDCLHLDFLQQFGKEDVHEVLLSLPDMYRVPLVLVHMEGFATKEVAKLLEVPLGTILARLHRGRKLFEKWMWECAVEAGLLPSADLRCDQREDNQALGENTPLSSHFRQSGPGRRTVRSLVRLKLPRRGISESPPAGYQKLSARSPRPDSHGWGFAWWAVTVRTADPCVVIEEHGKRATRGTLRLRRSAV